jgi:phage-related protein
MPSILVATGFVRIDSDTKPALKALKAFGALGGQALTVGLIPAAAAATTAIAGIGTAAALAGGAVTAFGAAVVPQFQSITKASQAQESAEQQATKATLAKKDAQRLAKEMGVKYGQEIKITSDMSDQAKASAEEYNTALRSAQSATKAAAKSQALYKEKMDAMPPATKTTALALEDLKDAQKTWSDSLAANTMPIFTKGLQFLTGLLPKLTPLVKETAAEISDFMSSLGEGTAGKVFREFGRNVSENGAGALRTFLEVGKNLIVGLLGIFNAFTPMQKQMSGGLENLTKRFAEWGATLGSSKGFATFTRIAQDAGPRLVKLFDALSKAFGKVASAAGPLSGIGLTLLTVFANLVNAIPTPVLKLLVPAILAVNTALKLYAIYTAVASAVTAAWTVVTFAQTDSTLLLQLQLALLWVQQKAVWVWTKLVTAAQWLWNAALTANPIGLVVLAVAALAAGLVIAYKKSETFRNIVQGAFKGVIDVGKAVGAWFSGPFVQFFTKTIPAAFQTTLNWVKTNWPWLLGALGGPVGLAATYIIKHWGEVRDFLSSAWTAIKKYAVQPFVDFFTDTIPKAGRDARDAVVGAIRWLALKVLDAFGWIISGAAKLFGWVPGVGGKLKEAEKAFRTFRDNVNEALGGIKDKNQNTFVTFKGKSIAAVSAGRMAAGGAIRGPGTSTSDSVPILASDNEHMWSAREVQGAGGHSAVERLRSMARSGGLPRFASGGAVNVKPRVPGLHSISSTAQAAYLRMVNLSGPALYAMMQQMISMLSAGPSFAGLGGKVGPSATAAMAYAQNLLKAHIYGWSMSQWPSWRSLGMGESGWRWNALNKSSGAYGIPQALPAGKMASAGADWRTNPATQIRWMASYIKGRYGTPAGAWSAWLHRSPHWYDRGGVLPPGLTMAYNGTGRNEYVSKTPPSGTVSIAQLVLENHGIIGSQRELENWLVTAFETLQRQGRIKVVTR